MTDKETSPSAGAKPRAKRAVERINRLAELMADRDDWKLLEVLPLMRQVDAELPQIREA